MKKFMILLVMVMCVNSVMAQFLGIKGLPFIYVRHANSSTITLEGGIKIPTEAVPFGEFITEGKPLPVAVGEAVRTRINYWDGDMFGLINEIGREQSKVAALTATLNAHKAQDSVSRAQKADANAAFNRSDSSYEARKHADAKRAAQRYAEKKADSTHTTTGSFATGL